MSVDFVSYSSFYGQLHRNLCVIHASNYVYELWYQQQRSCFLRFTILPEINIHRLLPCGVEMSPQNGGLYTEANIPCFCDVYN